MKEVEKNKYVQQEIEGFKKRGGWRGGGRPKGSTKEFKTVAIRIDERIAQLVETLKTELKEGRLTENDIAELEKQAKKGKLDFKEQEEQEKEIEKTCFFWINGTKRCTKAPIENKNYCEEHI